MMLSCLTTANSLLATAAPEMVARIKKRRRADVLAYAGLESFGSE